MPDRRKGKRLRVGTQVCRLSLKASLIRSPNAIDIDHRSAAMFDVWRCPPSFDLAIVYNVVSVSICLAAIEQSSSHQAGIVDREHRTKGHIETAPL